MNRKSVSSRRCCTTTRSPAGRTKTYNTTRTLRPERAGVRHIHILSIRSTVAVVLYTENQWLFFFYTSSLFCLVSWTSTTAGGLRWPTDSMFGFANPWSRLFINPRHSTCNSPRSVRSVRPSLHGRRQIHWRIAADAQRIGSIALKLTAGDVEERTLLPKRNKEASPTSIYIYYIIEKYRISKTWWWKVIGLSNGSSSFQQSWKWGGFLPSSFAFSRGPLITSSLIEPQVKLMAEEVAIGQEQKKRERERKKRHPFLADLVESAQQQQQGNTAPNRYLFRLGNAAASSHICLTVSMC